MPKRRYAVDLPALHAECDANYARLMRLLPAEGDARTVVIADRQPALALRLTVRERAPYTTTVTIIEEPQRRSGLIPPLALEVRLYHDASTAEVIAYQNQAQFWPRYRYPNSRMRAPDEKRQINALLSEVLAAALAHGRSHAPVVLGTPGR